MLMPGGDILGSLVAVPAGLTLVEGVAVGVHRGVILSAWELIEGVGRTRRRQANGWLV